MANLNDLKDLQNLDVNKLIESILSKKELCAKLAVVGVAIFVLISIISGYRAKDAELRLNIQKLNEKIEIGKTYDGAVKKMKDYLLNVPKEIDEDRISDQITEYAAIHNVNVINFSPGTRREEGFSTVITMVLTVHSTTFRDMLSFIKGIEDSPYALRFDACTIVEISTPGDEKNKKDDQERPLEAQITLSSVSVKK